MATVIPVGRSENAVGWAVERGSSKVQYLETD